MEVRQLLQERREQLVLVHFHWEEKGEERRETEESWTELWHIPISKDLLILIMAKAQKNYI